MRGATAGVIVGFTLIVGAATVYFGSTPAYAAEKVTLCHFPPDNPANFHMIMVSPKAAEAHIQNHGDVLGECCAIEDICDDDNPCTIESCESRSGCISEPVICGDGEACNGDTGAYLPVGQCLCWEGSNPIEKLRATVANSNVSSCIDTISLACDGERITLLGQDSIGPGSISLTLQEQNLSSCANPSGSGVQCNSNTGFGIFGNSTPSLGDACIQEFNAACDAVQQLPSE